MSSLKYLVKKQENFIKICCYILYSLTKGYYRIYKTCVSEPVYLIPLAKRVFGKHLFNLKIPPYNFTFIFVDNLFHFSCSL